MSSVRIRPFTTALAGVVVLCAPATAQLRVDIDRGNFRPLPIAVVPFGGDTPRTQILGRQISEIVLSDLEGSGLFRSLPPATFVQQNLTLRTPPRFADWRAIQAEALLTGEAWIDRNGRSGVRVILYDVYANKLIFENTLVFAGTSGTRRLGHAVADAIYQQLTGDGGYFDSKIAYVAESGPRIARKRRLAIMDQDGASHEYITDGRYEVITPRFSPRAQRLIYTALIPDVLNPLINRRRVYVYDIRSQRSDLIGEFPGMSYAARFSPDGRSVIMSLENNGNSDIFVVDIASRSQRRLTTSPAIDTSPSYAPDGKKIVFNSDRTNTPNLYVMRTDGKNDSCPSGTTQRSCRISFGSGRYLAPVWSPRGDLIAFTKQQDNKFYIGVIRPDGSNERLLTEAYLDEGPTWSPNGRVIAFFRESGPGQEPQLWSIDLSGRNLRRLKTPASASDPSWGPLIHQ